MANLRLWGAAVCLLVVISLCQAQSEGSPNWSEVFNQYSDGYTLTKDELNQVIIQTLGDYIQSINTDLLNELMSLADTNGDGTLTKQEFMTFIAFVTKKRG